MPKKIYELAKELDLGALDLVEELKASGFDVRNHMSSLSDDEVSKFLSAKEEKAAKDSDAKASKKKTKKKTAKKTTKKATKAKTTKKKTASKKTTKKVAKKASSSEAEEDTAEKAKTKTVVRRKAASKNSLEETQPQQSTLAAQLSEELGDDNQDVHSSGDENTATSGGLRIVSKPQSKPDSESAETQAKDEGTSEKGSDVYKEPVHKFTPVYIPTEEEKLQAAKDKEKKKAEGTTGTTTTEDSEESKTKKRLGGLATMMSGKKAAVSKSQALVMERAESELKSYAALSGSGRPIYTQVKKKKVYMGATEKTEITEVKDSKRYIELHKGGTISEIAHKLSVKLSELVNKCLDINLLVKEEDYVGIKLAEEIAALFSYKVNDIAFNEEEILQKKSEKPKSDLPTRSPVITIMGHVDHGKTTLVDYIRKAKVADGEAGGITQHVGAYLVQAKNKKLTFLDTPGHAAFASMRQRGADLTDIVVLVVAADDGVMPQTKESVKYCQQAGCPIIVAVNKMDKEGANPDKIKQELTEFNITPEDWGGDTQFVEISALKGNGIDDLIEAISLQAEMLELSANPKGKAQGVVIESKIEQGRGPIATILVQSGTLKKGDSLVVGETYGRARSLFDTVGKDVKNAGPSTPVQILGLSDAPSPGDSINVVKNEREAKKIVSNRVTERKQLEAMPSKEKVSLEDFFATAASEIGEAKSLNLIIRSDVQGSYEAIKQALEPLSNKEVELKIIGGGVGAISDSDVNLASSAEGFILGFNMRPLTSARKLSEQLGVDVKTYSIIYELIDDVKKAMEGLLDPEFEENYIGRAEVRDTFSVPKIGVIAGSAVIDGKLKMGCNVRLLREGKIIFDGKMSSLKRFKDDAKEVQTGYECGVGMENFNDIRVGDLFEAYELIEKKRTLNDVKADEEKAAKLKAEKAAEQQELSEQSL